jgi:hypothetical protein
MQEKKKRGGDQAKQVDNFDSSSEDEFEKVKTDKKRGAKKPEPVVQEVNPKFPASDPTKVKVIQAPTASQKKPAKNNKEEEEEKIVRPNTARKDGERPATAKKAQAPPAEDNPWMAMKKADEAGSKVESK